MVDVQGPVKIEISGVRVFGNHHEYEGDNPWWTLRFQSTLAKEEKEKISTLFNKSGISFKGNFDSLGWQSDRQCHWVTMDPWFESQEEWETFYEEVDELLVEVHGGFPLFALFFQKGQFHEGNRELIGLSDEELSSLPS